MLKMVGRCWEWLRDAGNGWEMVEMVWSGASTCELLDEKYW